MSAFIHHNKLDNNPEKSYEEIAIGQKQGCKNLIQSILYVKNTPVIFNKTKISQKIGYVISGKIKIKYEGVYLNQTINKTFTLGPGTSFLIPERTKSTLNNIDNNYSMILLVKSPQDEFAKLKKAKIDNFNENFLIVNKDDQQNLPAGEDRYFKLMIDPKYGSKYVTQFLGYIKKIKAPFHDHTYDEVIYILKGEGIVHHNNSKTQIKKGSSVYLPPGTIHRLENKNKNIELQLLGVFCPAGSPADKDEK